MYRELLHNVNIFKKMKFKKSRTYPNSKNRLSDKDKKLYSIKLKHQLENLRIEVSNETLTVLKE